MNPKTIGETTEAILLAEFIKKGEIVLLPFGNNQRYDLVLDRNGKFLRIQCKTGRWIEREGVVAFSVCSSQLHHGGVRRDYRGQIDYFGVYCPQLNECFLIPVRDAGKVEGRIRIHPPRNGQQKNVRWARDYRF